MPLLRFESHHVSENPSIAQALLVACKNERIFAFFGSLGAGKTTIIKDLCKQLGVMNKVTSPTFTLVNEYEGKSGPVYHFDFYRITSESEAYDIGCDEYLDSGYYCLIEWPEQIPSLLPADAVHISILVQPDGTRKIEVTYGEA